MDVIFKRHVSVTVDNICVKSSNITTFKKKIYPVDLLLYTDTHELNKNPFILTTFPLLLLLTADMSVYTVSHFSIYFIYLFKIRDSTNEILELVTRTPLNVKNRT